MVNHKKLYRLERQKGLCVVSYAGLSLDDDGLAIVVYTIFCNGRDL